VPFTVAQAAARAAVKVASRFGVDSKEPEILADAANVIVHLRPAPVVAKVAASTPEVRPEVASWLWRELDLAAFLTAAGAPALAPSPEIPATPYHEDGRVMSFWTYVPSPGTRADEAVIGAMLRDLHAVLRSYPRELPVLVPLQDIPAFLARPQTRRGLSPAVFAALAVAYERLIAELAGPTAAPASAAAAPSPVAGQALHGDAGVGNLLATADGWLWHDFEDTCSGPLAWDLAATTANPRLDGARILAAYGEPVDPAQLAVCQQLRRLNLTVWMSLYAERRPELRPRAAELLAEWPMP
jgi:Phosphotransferase enzyme family